MTTQSNQIVDLRRMLAEAEALLAEARLLNALAMADNERLKAIQERMRPAMRICDRVEWVFDYMRQERCGFLEASQAFERASL